LLLTKCFDKIIFNLNQTIRSVIPAPAFAGVNLSPRKRGAGIQKHNVKQYYVYILASKRNGTLYIGVTNNLLKRVYEHKNNLVEGFTQKYKVHNLVYYEIYYDVYTAIAREKAMKKWKRVWKIELIEKDNPLWKDLFCDMVY
jgi:putative endonuclease